MKVVLATFHTPGIRAIEYLIQAGFQPAQIRVLTHDLEKNRFLIDYDRGQNIETHTYPAKTGEALAWIQEFKPDVLFSLYFRTIIPHSILEIPALGCINLHPALLPKYRGTFSAPWAIINAEPFTGFTYHRMLSQVDAGRIILQRRVNILEDDTAFSLYHRLLIEGMNAFGEAFHLVTQERFAGSPQVGEPSYFPRQVPYGGYIDPSWSRAQIDRYIRAMYFPPFKGAMVRLSDGSDREVSTIAEYDTVCASGIVIRHNPHPV